VKITNEEAQERLSDERFPRSANYDAQWILANQMGPNALWLTESLCERMTLKPGMHVLDMGCGTAMSSIFLAKEFGVQVWANDLWIRAEANHERIVEAGVADLVSPVHAEAHSLPYDRGYFDAVVTVDSYHYYGTSDTYLGYFASFLKPGAQIGMAVPGLMKEIEGALPAYLTEKDEAGNRFWDPKECWSFHTADWWRNHWEHTGIVDIEHAAAMKDGWSIWLKFDDVVVAAAEPMPLLGAPTLDNGNALRADQGEYLGLIETIARVRE
jgi:cyclopropane fatty-acyl-phospholipid synthase-like methyltransferase